MVNRMEIYGDSACCGMSEISCLSEYDTPEKAMKSFAASFGIFGKDEKMAAHVLFTQAERKGRKEARYGDNVGHKLGTYGTEFAAFIKKHKLGTVVKTRPIKNPNSGNLVTGFLWTPSVPAIKKWLKTTDPDAYKDMRENREEHYNDWW